MLKIPYGVSGFSDMILGGHYYVDRTQYIEKLESLTERYLIYIRPRRFGKSLFISTLQHYIFIWPQSFGYSIEWSPSAPEQYTFLLKAYWCPKTIHSNLIDLIDYCALTAIAHLYHIRLSVLRLLLADEIEG